MTDQIIALVPTYGLSLLALIVALGCLALPVPSSLVMLTSGSFISAGDLPLMPTLAAAYFAAVLGDQLGFHIGRWGGPPLLLRLATNKDRKQLLDRAHRSTQNRGGTGVFLSRWLVSPLGPYVNFIAGATGLSWLRFTIWGSAGEVIWVGFYVGLGVIFAENISAVGEIATDMSGLIAAGVITLFLGWLITRALRKHKPRT